MLEKIRLLVEMAEIGVITTEQLVSALRALIEPAYDPMTKGGDL